MEQRSVDNSFIHRLTYVFVETFVHIGCTDCMTQENYKLRGPVQANHPMTTGRKRVSNVCILLIGTKRTAPLVILQPASRSAR